MTPTLAVRAYTELRRRLANGTLQPGAQLVNRKLAASIGMSMTPVREAVNRLASEGLVEQRPGAGAFVRRIERYEFAQLYDVREAVEPLAAAQAAALVTPAEIAELEAIEALASRVVQRMRDRMEPTQELQARWCELELQFHTVLVEAARNAWITKIIIDAKVLTTCFVRHKTLGAFPDVASGMQTLRDHRRLISALRNRNPDVAARVMREHIQAGRTAAFATIAASAAGDNGTPATSPRPDSRRRSTQGHAVARPRGDLTPSPCGRPGRPGTARRGGPRGGGRGPSSR